MKSVCSIKDLPPIVNPENLYDCEYTPGDSNDPHVEFIAFSGGGVLGVSFAGVAKQLELHNIRKNVKYWLGSSAGAICASFCALNIPADTMIEVIQSTDIGVFFGDISQYLQPSDSLMNTVLTHQNDIIELITKLGIHSGEKFTCWFQEQLKTLGLCEDLTFSDLYELTGNHLIITTTSINTYETLYLSRSSYPYMRIVDAVHSSIIVPFLIQPLIMKDRTSPSGKRVLNDGGCMDNLPLNACDVISETGEIIAYNRRAIAFTLVSNGKWCPDHVEITNLFSYAFTFASVLHHCIHAMKSHQPYFWDRVVPIECFDNKPFDFQAKPEQIKQLYMSGMANTHKFLEKRERILREKGPLPRNLFIPSYRLRYHGIEYVSDSMVDYTQIYQTNPENFRKNSIVCLRK